MGTEGWAITEDAVIRVIKVIGVEAENIVSEIGVCTQEINIPRAHVEHHAIRGLSTIPQPGEAQRLHRCLGTV